MIKGPFFGEIGKPKTTADCRRWSFYTALLFPSSSCAREVRARHRLKSFGREPVRNAGKWRGMADGYACKGTVFTGARSAVGVRDGLSFGCGGTCAGIAATR